MTLRIRSVEAVPLRVRFKHRFSFGVTDREASQNVVLKVTTDEGLVGYGEACPVSAFTAETQESVVQAIEKVVSPLLVGADAMARTPLVRRLEPRLPHAPFTITAVDLALFDLAGKATGLSASALLGGRFREQVEVHGSVGWAAPEEMVETANAQLERGFAALKLYAGRGELPDDLERLVAVRRAIPAHVRLMVDVNGMWTVGECLRALPVLREIGVVLLEQPLPASNTAGQAEVTAASSIDTAADESVFTPADVAAIARGRTARVVNLGISKLGGLLRASECSAVARAGGLGVMVGSVLELGIANAAGLHFAAASPELAYPSYLIGPLKYERDIVTQPLEVNAGHVAVPTGPGLGVEVDEELLAAMDARRGP
jgi:L-alanine-DL-glutamate epimerase-like enolase superfamily enzyme